MDSLELPQTSPRRALVRNPQGQGDLCQCGCRGWCTWFPLLLALAWDLCACAIGTKDGFSEFGLELGTGLVKLNFVLCILEARQTPRQRCWVGGQEPKARCHEKSQGTHGRLKTAGGFPSLFHLSRCSCLALFLFVHRASLS